MPFLIHALRAAALAAIVVCGPQAAAAQPPGAPPPISSFFSNSPFGGAKLSPSARYLATRSSAPGQRDFLLVVDLQNSSGKIVASYSDSDVGDFEWVNDERLNFDTREKGVGQGNVRGWLLDHKGEPRLATTFADNFRRPGAGMLPPSFHPSAA